MVRLLSMKLVGIAFRDLIIPKMRELKNLLVLLLTQLEKPLLLVISIDSMFIILTLRDHNGMKYVVSKLKIITLLRHVPGKLMDQKLEWDLFVDLSISSMFA